MTLFASLADSRVVSARLTLPAFGCWTADVRLAEDDELPPSALTLTIGNLALVGTVVRGGPFVGTRSVRMVGGFGGWGNPVEARFYGLNSGVSVSTVLRDAAAEVGEQIVVSAEDDIPVGPFYLRAAGTASRVLSALVGRDGWHVDSAGITRLGDRASTPITSDFDIPGGGYRPELGLVTIATEDLLSWQPGAVFEHALLQTPQQASSVSVELAPNGKLRLEVMVA